MNEEWILALIGGAIIGVAVSIMLIFNGRVTGISGIVSTALIPKKGDFLWRIIFVSGLFVGGLVMTNLRPQAFQSTVIAESWTTVIAGLLVGFGTSLGSGCTSGHGVCGLSRLSVRSLVATISFISTGIVAGIIFRKLGWLL
jgi:uncharacterized protein